MNMNQTNKENMLLKGLKEVSNIKYTENGAVALESTLSPLLDAFGELGALRSADIDRITTLFMKAYAVDKLLALKMLFYTRDIRGGLGEKRTFKTILKYLAINYPTDIRVNISLIPEYGRWDDLYTLIGTPLQDEALSLMKDQFTADLSAVSNASTNEVPHISLLGKWLKSENTSSIESRRLATITREYFGLSSSQYRKALTSLRKAIKVVEVNMSDNQWETIDYSAVPSIASKNYKRAFLKHDEDRYTEFLSKVATGEEKINATTLYPYDLVKEYLGSWGPRTRSLNETTEAQWKALPNYLEGKENTNFLIMSDVSGSMFCDNNTPIATSVGLAIYFAERSQGAFANNFITFTDYPKLVTLPENLSLLEKVKTVTHDVGYDTDIEAAFNMVLRAASAQKIPASDMPTAIVIISDMEFNEFGEGDRNLNFTSAMERKFEEAGYKMPTLVYWNVCARQDTFHAVADQNVRFISGHSASVFKGLCENLGYSAFELMLNILNSERYSAVKLAK